mmetsp:Transcript_23048/g.42467  ORF Transcript_23048/g.42467 Transcript_23048/m.42467 type:complete len:181 (-) Transcript_23048:79-621(-)
MDWFASAERWQRLLVVAGGAAASGALVWYLIRDSGSEQENDAEDEDQGDVEYWKVTDAKKANVGLRTMPATSADRTGRSLFAGQVFEVSRVEPAPLDDVEGQQYLHLQDGSGWAFTHSSRDGRVLCERVTLQEAKETVANYTEQQQVMLQLQEQLLQHPELAQQATLLAQSFQQQQQKAP